ncbi:RNA methyltransferase [Halobacteriovorax marinus]|uniref:RNA methyltransferase n=1 Tax=Halobacteriovorax marinus TaxID=97084 RepID=UPI003A8F27F7
MAIEIPNKAFLSFSYKQCINTLYRAFKQVDDKWDNESLRLNSLKILENNLVALKSHEDEALIGLGQEILSDFPSTRSKLQELLMKLERIENKDLKDSDFLITTEDDFAKINDEPNPIHLVLDNLRSSFNVGSLFRTAEAIGIKEVHLCGYTPTPENSKTAKSALGTDKWIKWSYWESSLDCIDALKERGVDIYAFETEKNAKALEEVREIRECAIVLGNERYGLNESVLNRSDEILKIRLDGKKNSLNVGICGAIAMHHMARIQRENK